jgi:uncharacterized protein DUF6894
MPRYFFHVMEAKSLRNSVRDAEGTVLSDEREAKKEAIGLAQDIATHGVHGSGEWTVVVTDEYGNSILTVPLSEVRARRTRPWLKLRSRISNFVSGSPHRFAWSIVAGAIVVLGIVTTVLFQDKGTYQTASAPSPGAIVAVRFVAQANAADVTRFLEAYKGSIVDGPRSGGFYRIRISETPLPQDQLAKLAARMGQEKVVDFIAVPQ